MAVAKLCLGDDTLFIDKGDGKLYRRDLGKEGDEEVPTPYGVERWLELGKALHGLARVVGKDMKPDPEIGDDFPLLVPKTLDEVEEGAGQEVVYVVSGVWKQTDGEWTPQPDGE